MKWSYGITTVASRFHDTLPVTIDSLAKGGFPDPIIFVDGPAKYDTGLEVVNRSTQIKAYKHWLLTAVELYGRRPNAERYAIFQDDFVTYLNLREYLENTHYHAKGYWNLYTFPENEKPKEGFYLSNQKGKGAVALIFNNEALRTLLSQSHLWTMVQCGKNGDRKIDGHISDSFRNVGFKEYVHMPSLVQHIGAASAIGNAQHAEAPSFLGTDYNALELLKPAFKKAPNKPDQPAGENLTEKTQTAKIRAISLRNRPVRIGLVGYSCPSGLGEVNRQIATWIDCDTWLMKPHHYGLGEHPDIPVDRWVCPTGKKIEKWLKGVDVVVFSETPVYSNLIAECKKQDKKTVCVPMIEWFPEQGAGWPQKVDLFLAPTQQCYDILSQERLPGKLVNLPWPIDTERFSFRHHKKVERFLFLNGHGGWKGRKGAEVIRKLLKLWPDIPLLVGTQVRSSWPHQTEFIGAPIKNSDLYNQGDVLLAPHSVDGLGLELLEAMACGIPVLPTSGKPWDEWPALAFIPSKVTTQKIGRNMPWHIPKADQLLRLCKELIGSDITQESLAARQWCEDRSWSVLASQVTAIIRDA